MCTSNHIIHHLPLLRVIEDIVSRVYLIDTLPLIIDLLISLIAIQAAARGGAEPHGGQVQAQLALGPGLHFQQTQHGLSHGLRISEGENGV